MLGTPKPATGIPTEAEWNEWPLEGERYLDLDEHYAKRQFFGKSFEEAVELFRDSEVLMRSEDVSYMPPVPFRYYLSAYAAHMAAGAPSTCGSYASSAASSFLSLVERKLETERPSIEPIMPQLMPVVDMVARNQQRYDADIDTYGDFLEQLERIQNLRGA